MLPKEMRKLSIEEAVHVGSLMDAQKSASDIFIDYNFKPNQLPKHSVNWAYELHDYKSVKIQISPRTMRPCYRVNNKVWEEVAMETFSVPVNKMMSGMKYYQNFLEKHGKIPTKDELIIFYYNRYVVANKKSTLPYLTERWAGEVISDYNEAFEISKCSVKEAVEIINSSMSIVKREEFEKWNDK